jgi:hypothetical protein
MAPHGRLPRSDLQQPRPLERHRACLKRWRVFASRHERTASSILGARWLAAAFDWLRR